ncbi:MAG TPA: GAF domain-containing sensor histidine kinase [Desulfobacterales bacterium]|nr:GAF domain-containing sensor histidine kinase [Desulfobacterales bacterium]
MVAAAHHPENHPPGGSLEQTRRLVRIRWWAAGGVLTAVVGAAAAGVVFPAWQFLLVFGFILTYNTWIFRRTRGRPDDRVSTPEARWLFTLWQIALDAAALWGLTCLSGGVASPVVFGLLLPVIGAAVLLSPRAAHLFCAASITVLSLTALAEFSGGLPHLSILYQGHELTPLPHPLQLAVNLGIFAAVALLAARFAATVVHSLRRQVDDLGRLQQAESDFGRKLQTLFSIMEGIGSALELEQVLTTATAEVALVMQVKASSVKLLTEDGKFLRYAAAFGLPESFVRDQVVEVARSPLNRRIIDGEPFVTGQVTAKEMFQFGEVLSAAQIQSVLFVPLLVENRVMGILGAYCEKPARFSDRDVEFFRLAAGLVAIAIENARAYEAVKTMSNERNWFMMKVTHNLRAPLAGMLSILEVVREGYLGAINEEQSEYLRRLDRRARTMLSMINGLMALSRNRERARLDPSATTAPEELARRVRRTFQDKAAEKRLAFQVKLPESLPLIRGPLETLEQLLENLVSNAIKYTPAEGSVEVKFAKANGTVRIEVSDTGIGIPAADRPRLFTEFFRAENAKSMDEVGTGLGLAIVKEIVDKLGGRTLIESEEGVGTIFVVHLPVAPAAKEART